MTKACRDQMRFIKAGDRAWFTVKKPAHAFLIAASLCLGMLAAPCLAENSASVAVPDPTMAPRVAVNPTPAKPAAAPSATPKPYVPPALNNVPTPESNVILPPLYGWNRIVLHDLKMPDSDEIVNNCGMKQDMIFQFFANHLQEGGVPVVSEDQAVHLIPDVVTVEAQPSITSMQDLVINCISYVQFRVKMDLTFRVPPMMYRRTVPILLWNDGTMVSSAKSTHNGALINAFIAMAERFKDAWTKQNTLVEHPQQLITH